MQQRLRRWIGRIAAQKIVVVQGNLTGIARVEMPDGQPAR
jgi:hypothetical protein